jgi:purine-nucleoside phosphorylase
VDNFRANMEETVNYLRQRIVNPAQIGMILGTGLGELAAEVREQVVIPYKCIPHFPQSMVESHAGNLICGKLGDKEVLVLQGRCHYYEGYSMQELTFPIRVMGALGINKLLITNAAGGINPAFSPGDLMLIKDHINFMGNNPLIGFNDPELGPRFPDMSAAYNEDLQLLALRKSQEVGIEIKKGVYIGVTGPSFETPAELAFFAQIGADAVGMSTVPEVIVANHMGMRVLGISCITNMAVGHQPHNINHMQVIDVARKACASLQLLLKAIVEAI